MVASSRKLRYYFQSHQVTIVTDQPLNEIIKNKETSGRITKWAVELAEYDLIYEIRKTIKSQVLADFIVEWTTTSKLAIPEDQEYWTLFTDGAWGMLVTRASTILISPTGLKLTYAVRLNSQQQTTWQNMKECTRITKDKSPRGPKNADKNRRASCGWSKSSWYDTLNWSSMLH